MYSVCIYIGLKIAAQHTSKDRADKIQENQDNRGMGHLTHPDTSAQAMHALILWWTASGAAVDLQPEDTLHIPPRVCQTGLQTGSDGGHVHTLGRVAFTAGGDQGQQWRVTASLAGSGVPLNTCFVIC